MIDVLIGLALLALGFYFGRKTGAEKPRLPAVDRTEQERLAEDRQAFSQLMGYNADRAYGKAGDGYGI